MKSEIIYKSHKKPPKAPKASVKVKANIVVDGDDVDTRTIHIDADNDWGTVIKGMDFNGKIDLDFEELAVVFVQMGDSLELNFKDFDFEGLAELFDINLDSIITNSIAVKGFHKRKMKR